MGHADKVISTGDIIARQTDTFGNDLVTAAVTMTAEAWDRLTAGYVGFHRWLTDNPAVPDLTLAERIDVFLEHEVLVWEADHQRVGPFDDDLDDDVPF